MRASLPMYDLECVRPWTDAWWRGLDRAVRRAGLPPLPALTRSDDRQAIWGAADLILSQICGYAIAQGFRGRLQPVLTPCYAAPGCDGPRYRSVLLVREDSPAHSLADLRGGICACNDADSQSGINTLARAVAPLADTRGFFAGHRFTGAHIASMAAVRAGQADVCAVDCVTYALLRRHAADAVTGLRSIGYSGSAPGLPYVTAVGTPVDTVRRLRAAILEALADPSLVEAREALFLSDAAPLTANDYDEIVVWPRDALGRTLN